MFKKIASLSTAIVLVLTMSARPVFANVAITGTIEPTQLSIEQSLITGGVDGKTTTVIKNTGNASIQVSLGMKGDLKLNPIYSYIKMFELEFAQYYEEDYLESEGTWAKIQAIQKNALKAIKESLDRGETDVESIIGSAADDAKFESAKGKAVKELKVFFSGLERSEYLAEEWLAVRDIVNNAIAAVRNAPTVEDIIGDTGTGTPGIVEVAKTDVNNASKSGGAAAEAAKAAVDDKLSELKGQNSYTQASEDILDSIKASAETDIDNASTQLEIDQIVAQAKADMDLVPTGDVDSQAGYANTSEFLVGLSLYAADYFTEEWEQITNNNDDGLADLAFIAYGSASYNEEKIFIIEKLREDIAKLCNRQQYIDTLAFPSLYTDMSAFLEDTNNQINAATNRQTVDDIISSLSSGIDLLLAKNEAIEKINEWYKKIKWNYSLADRAVLEALIDGKITAIKAAADKAEFDDALIDVIDDNGDVAAAAMMSGAGITEMTYFSDLKTALDDIETYITSNSIDIEYGCIIVNSAPNGNATDINGLINAAYAAKNDCIQYTHSDDTEAAAQELTALGIDFTDYNNLISAYEFYEICEELKTKVLDFQALIASFNISDESSIAELDLGQQSDLESGINGIESRLADVGSLPGIGTSNAQNFFDNFDAAFDSDLGAVRTYLTGDYTIIKGYWDAFSGSTPSQPINAGYIEALISSAPSSNPPADDTEADAMRAALENIKDAIYDFTLEGGDVGDITNLITYEDLCEVINGYDRIKLESALANISWDESSSKWDNEKLSKNNIVAAVTASNEAYERIINYNKFKQYDANGPIDISIWENLFSAIKEYCGDAYPFVPASAPIMGALTAIASGLQNDDLIKTPSVDISGNTIKPANENEYTVYIEYSIVGEAEPPVMENIKYDPKLKDDGNDATPITLATGQTLQFVIHLETWLDLGEDTYKFFDTSDIGFKDGGITVGLQGGTPIVVTGNSVVDSDVDSITSTSIASPGIKTSETLVFDSGTTDIEIGLELGDAAYYDTIDETKISVFISDGIYRYKLNLGDNDGYTYDSTMGDEKITIKEAALNGLTDGQYIITVEFNTKLGIVADGIGLVVDINSSGSLPTIITTPSPEWSTDSDLEIGYDLGTGPGVATGVAGVKVNGVLLAAEDYNDTTGSKVTIDKDTLENMALSTNFNVTIIFNSLVKTTETVEVTYSAP